MILKLIDTKGKDEVFSVIRNAESIPRVGDYICPKFMRLCQYRVDKVCHDFTEEEHTVLLYVTFKAFEETKL